MKERSSEIFRAVPAMAANKLRTDVSPNPSTFSRWISLLRASNVKISAGSLTHSRS